MHLSVIKETGLRKFCMVEDKWIKVSSNGVGFEFVFCMTCYIDILNKIMKHKWCCTQCMKLPLLWGSGSGRGVSQTTLPPSVSISVCCTWIIVNTWK